MASDRKWLINCCIFFELIEAERTDQRVNGCARRSSELNKSFEAEAEGSERFC